MRKIGLLAAVAAVSLLTPWVAQGAAKPISQSPMTLVATVSASSQTVGMAVRGRTIFLIGTVTGVVSTDGYVQALDSAGNIQWSLPLDNGSNEIASAATFDTTGNLWVVGSAQTTNTAYTPPPMDTATATSAPTPTSTVLNPDGVNLDPLLPMRTDLNSLALWKISPSGVLLARYATDLGSAFLVRGVIFVNNSIVVVGIISTPSGHAGFLIQSDVNGSFGKPVLVGNSDTDLNALSKKSDGSLVLMGSSSETIAQRARGGVHDAISVVVTKAGKLTQVVRSYNKGSNRSWQSGTNSFFLGGDALASNKQEAVVTKFAASLVPTWTLRFASTGPALTADGPASHFLLFPSVGAVNGIKRWKPSKPAALVLNLDSKGALKGAYGVASISTPMAIGYSPALGVVVLGRGPIGVSVFHTLPR